MILVVTDMKQQGSGYQRIMTELVNRLVSLMPDETFVCLGFDYKNQEHWNNFRIVPVSHASHIPNQISLIASYGQKIKAVFIALDIPIQMAILNHMQQAGLSTIPVIGFFPVESGPIAQKWATAILGMRERVVMSLHAQKALKQAGLDSHFLPVGVGEEWVPEYNNESRRQYKKSLGIDPESFVVLTVAENQERKNLAAAFEAFSDFSTIIRKRNEAGFVTEKETIRKAHWVLVTRINSAVGLDLQDLAMRHGVLDKVSFIERGIPNSQLVKLYQMADTFLLTSKAEGLGMPILEAMATNTPVVATRVSAIEDHLIGGVDEKDSFYLDSTSKIRGFAVESLFEHTDHFGNGRRKWVDPYQASLWLTHAYRAWLMENGITDENEPDLAYEEMHAVRAMLERAREYVFARDWNTSAAQMADIINSVIGE